MEVSLERHFFTIVPLTAEAPVTVRDRCVNPGRTERYVPVTPATWRQLHRSGNTSGQFLLQCGKQTKISECQIPDCVAAGETFANRYFAVSFEPAVLCVVAHC